MKYNTNTFAVAAAIASRCAHRGPARAQRPRARVHRGCVRPVGRPALWIRRPTSSSWRRAARPPSSRKPARSAASWSAASSHLWRGSTRASRSGTIEEMQQASLVFGEVIGADRSGAAEAARVGRPPVDARPSREEAVMSYTRRAFVKAVGLGVASRGATSAWAALTGTRTPPPRPRSCTTRTRSAPPCSTRGAALGAGGRAWVLLRRGRRAPARDRRPLRRHAGERGDRLRVHASSAMHSS